MRHAKRLKIATVAATLAIVALALAPATGQATTLVPLSVEEMAAMADSVVLADADDVTSRPVPGANGAASLATIETDVSMRVVQVLKGALVPEANFTLAGGELGERGFLATWDPTLTAGERAIVFLDEDGRPLGPQAKLTVDDGYITSLGRSVTDVMTEVLGAEPLGPMAGEAPRLAAASLILPESEGFELPATQATHINDGFESGTIDPGTWALFDGGHGTTWTVTTERAASGTYSVYCDDDVAAGGPYSTDSTAAIIAGPFDLSSASSAYLSYQAFIDVDGVDDVLFMYSTNGSNFEGFSHTSPPAGWFADQIDLSDWYDRFGGTDLIGENAVWVAFLFESDSTPNTAEGVYLDDIVLQEDPAGPSLASIDPPTGSAGTDTEVTLTGTGFGAVQGSGDVEFTYDQLDGTTIDGEVTSWSDTQITCIVPIVEDPHEYPGAASSGPARVITGSGQRSNSRNFTVDFAYGGIKWPTPEAEYRFNANTSDTTSEQSLFDAAAATWSGVSVFDFPNVGTTSTNDYTNNGRNEVFWTNTALPSSVLAAAGIWYTGDEIEECDIGFNDTKLWGDGGGSSYDIQTIAVHELGHWLNLRDLYGNADDDKIMYGYGSPSGTKRTLEPGDIAGIEWIYSSSALQVSVTPDPSIVLPSEPVTYTYTVSNVTTLPATGVTITDSRFGQIGSTVTTLAPESDLTTTYVHGGFSNTGVRNNSVSVEATVGGLPATAQTSVSVRVALPTLRLNVSSASVPVLVGTEVAIDYVVTNNGYFTLRNVVVTDPENGVNAPISGSIAAGSSKSVRIVKAANGPLTAGGSASGWYSGYEATDGAPDIVVSTYERIAGSDRVDTAVRASKRAYPLAGSANAVVVASAYAWADALPASGLAGAVDGPLLLVSPSGLTQAVTAEISRLGASQVYIAGGTAVVSPAIQSALDAMPGVSTKRLGGTNRYGTARLIANEMLAVPGAGPFDTVFVATGRNFPDALAASSLAAAMPAPILLTEPGSLPGDTRSALAAVDPDHVVVCGGTAVVSSGVEGSLGAYGSVVRRGGVDRYATGRSVVDYGTARLAPSGPTGVFLAVGTNYPDALAGGVVAARANGSWNPLMLTPASTLDPYAAAYMNAHDSVAHVGVMGGEAAVSAFVLSSAKTLLP